MIVVCCVSLSGKCSVAIGSVYEMLHQNRQCHTPPPPPPPANNNNNNSNHPQHHQHQQRAASQKYKKRLCLFLSVCHRWRAKALKRAREKAEKSGQSVEELVGERYIHTSDRCCVLVLLQRNCVRQSATPFEYKRSPKSCGTSCVFCTKAFDGALRMELRLCCHHVLLFLFLSQGWMSIITIAITVTSPSTKCLSEWEMRALGQRDRDRLNRTIESPSGIKAMYFLYQRYHEQNTALYVGRGAR